MATVPVPGAGDALVVVDHPSDRRPTGSPDMSLRAGLHDWVAAFARRGLPVVVGRDWSVRYRCTLASSQLAGLPPRRTPDSSATPLASPQVGPDKRLAWSGMPDRAGECGSCFAGTGLHTRLQALGVRRLFVAGRTEGIRVLETVEDALSLGYAVVVLAECLRAIDSPSGNAARALAAMRASGALLLES